MFCWDVTLVSMSTGQQENAVFAAKWSPEYMGGIDGSVGLCATIMRNDPRNPTPRDFVSTNVKLMARDDDQMSLDWDVPDEYGG